MAYRWGLRGQSTLSLLLALIPALLIGWLALDNVRQHFATRSNSASCCASTAPSHAA